MEEEWKKKCSKHTTASTPTFLASPVAVVSGACWVVYFKKCIQIPLNI